MMLWFLGCSDRQAPMATAFSTSCSHGRSPFPFQLLIQHHAGSFLVLRENGPALVGPWSVTLGLQGKCDRMHEVAPPPLLSCDIREMCDCSGPFHPQGVMKEA